RRVARGRAAGDRPAALFALWQAARVGDLDLASRRRTADVLRLALAERDFDVDAQSGRRDQPAGDPLYGRNLRLLSAGGQPAVENAALDPAQASPRVWTGYRAGDAEPGRPGLQGLVERGHVVFGPPADRTRQDARDRRAGRRRRRRRRRFRPRTR